MAKNIPSNENHKPSTKATLPSKVLNQDRSPNKEFPRQKKSKTIHLHQTNTESNAKGTTLRKKKNERVRNTDSEGIKWQRISTYQ